MAGLLSGPLGQIAEAALETVCDNVPLGKVGLKALKTAVKDGVNITPKLSAEEKIRFKYKTIGAHIEGACRILKPAMELKNILSQSKSADREKSDFYPLVSFHYYTPQKQSNQCRCAEETGQKDFTKETQFDKQKGFSTKPIYLEKENSPFSKYRGSVKKEIKFSNDEDFDFDSNLKSKNNLSWKKCDACQAVSKFLIPTTCDHAICQRCVKNGQDCQKCLLIPARKIKSEPKEKLYHRLFDTD